MLVVTLKVGESVVFLDEETEIKVTRVGNNNVRLAIEAPASRRILRNKLAYKPICLRAGDPRKAAAHG